MTDGKWKLPLDNIFHIPFDIFHFSLFRRLMSLVDARLCRQTV